MKKSIIIALVAVMLISVVLFVGCQKSPLFSADVWEKLFDTTGARYVLLSDDDFISILEEYKNDTENVWTKQELADMLNAYHVQNGVEFSYDGYVKMINDAKNARTQIVIGECTYPNAWNPTGAPYGCRVAVGVTDGVITAITLYSDEESGMIRTSSSNEIAGWSKEFAESKYNAYIHGFIGKTVEEINAIKVLPDSASVSSIAIGALADREVVLFGGESTYVIAGATQSSARIVVAIQNALSKLAK